MFYIRRVGQAAAQYVPGELRRRRVVRTHATPRASAIQDESTEGQDTAFRKVAEAYREATEGEPQRRRLVFARDLMSSPVITIEHTKSVLEAWQAITTGRVRHLPVTNQGTLVGIVSDRDLLRHFGNVDALDTRPVFQVPIVDLMEREVLTATPDTEIRVIAKVMFDESVGCLPIAAEDGTLVGIVTRSDILRALTTHAPLELWG